jgi:hypothetical protein
VNETSNYAIEQWFVVSVWKNKSPQRGKSLNRAPDDLQQRCVQEIISKPILLQWEHKLLATSSIKTYQETEDHQPKDGGEDLSRNLLPGYQKCQPLNDQQTTKYRTRQCKGT